MSSLTIVAALFILLSLISFNSSFVLVIPLLAFSYAISEGLEDIWARYLILFSALILPLMVVFFIKGGILNFPRAALTFIYLSMLALMFEEDSFYTLIAQLLSADEISLVMITKFLGQTLSISALIGAVALLMVGLFQIIPALFNKDKILSWSPTFQSLTPMLIIFIIGLSLRFIDSLIIESHNLF